ncbi:MAG: hypothetical protein ACHQJ4_04965, partial [Ignavibacteria bacterium]
MIPFLRKKYNSEFTLDKYNSFIEDIDSQFGYKVEFRIAETPIFIPRELASSLISAGDEIINYLRSDDFKAHSRSAIPSGLEVPDEDSHTKLLAIDFAVCRDDSGNLIPRLIELQGFPSLYFYQALLNLKYREHFNIPLNFTNYFNGLDDDKYISLLKNVIVGDNAPENVVLLEIEPEKQKTKIDFSCTEKWIGIKPVCITQIKKEGKKLYYENNGKKTPVNRIYNRVIFDELNKRTDLNLNFSFSDDIDVEWVPHPNWFFRISKHTLPGLRSKYVPETKFLNEMDSVPGNLQDYVLKPLYSFAGAGVKYDITGKDIERINDRENYILQRKITYAPVIETPGTPAKAEIRLLYIWDDEPVLVNNIVRLSKGKMMGVDFNKDRSWVGSSIG